MKHLAILQRLVSDTKCKIRLKTNLNDQATDWKNWLGLPVEGYIEVGGPERIADVEWIELDPVVVTHLGRLVPPRVASVTDVIQAVLNKESIQFEVVEGMMRLYGKQLS